MKHLKRKPLSAETISLLQTYGRATSSVWHTAFESLAESICDWEYFDAERRIRILLFQAILNRDAYNPILPEYPCGPPAYGFPGFDKGICFRPENLEPSHEVHAAADKMGFNPLRHLRDRYPVSQLAPCLVFEFLDFYNPDSMGVRCNDMIVARVVTAGSPLEVDQVIVIDTASLLGADSPVIL